MNIKIPESNIFDDMEKPSLEEHNAVLQKESNEALLEKKLKEIKKVYKKRGPKPFVVDKKFIKTVYNLSFKGLINNQIYPKFDICADTWAELKNAHPEISEAYNKGKSDRVELALSYVDDILSNPKNKNHFNALKLTLDPWLKNQEKPTQLEVSVKNFDNLSEEELLKKLNE